jgi:hypothetical protein
MFCSKARAALGQFDCGGKFCFLNKLFILNHTMVPKTKPTTALGPTIVATNVGLLIRGVSHTNHMNAMANKPPQPNIPQMSAYRIHVAMDQSSRRRKAPILGSPRRAAFKRLDHLD